MRIRRDFSADLGEVEVHRLDIHLRQYQARADLPCGTNRAEDVGPIVALIARRSRTAATLGPDVGQAALLTDAGLVLPPKFDRPVALVGRNRRRDQRSKVFLCASCSDASACGWRGRTEIRLKPRRRSSLPTLRSCSWTLNVAAIFACRSTRRQRTMPSFSGSGPVRTHSATSACCSAVNREHAPPPCGWLLSPAIPSAL